MMLVLMWWCCGGWLAQDPSPLVVPADELFDELREAPLLQQEREQRLVELFRQAGAAEDGIELFPLKIEVDQKLQSIERKLREAGQSAAEILAIQKKERELWSQPMNNVIARIPGSGDRILVLCANFDAVEGGNRVLLNWTGCVAMANVYQSLRAAGLSHQLWCVGFAAQGLGCVGSRTWVQSLQKEQLEKIDAVIDLECLGMADPAVFADQSSVGLKWVAREAAREIGLELPIRDYENLPSKSSDLTAFRSRKIPTLFIDGIDPSRADLLFKPAGIEAVDPKAMDSAHRLVVRILLALDPMPFPVTTEVLEEKGLSRQDIALLQKPSIVALTLREPELPADKKPAESKPASDHEHP